MASGSSKGFDFASDDILCSYEDYANQETNNGTHSDSAKEFHKSRMARTAGFPASSYSPPDDSSSQEVIILAVERSMKKYTDNLMRFLEGLSSRLSQLELYCYNVDKSIGEMRSELTRDHGEADLKLRFLEKHLQEVHRSVQILRDKQELADTQKELAKLQKESSSSHNSQKNEDQRSSTPETKKTDNSGDSHGQQLALALPSQVAPPPAAPQPPRAPPPMSQPPAYYLPPAPVSTQYQQPQVPPPQVQPQPQLPPQYQQQWAQQVPPPPSMQPVSRPTSPQVYLPYLPSQPVNPSTQPPPEPLPNSMPMQMQYSGVPPPGSSQQMTYTYGGPVRTSQPPQQHLKPTFGGQPGGDGYAASGLPPQGNAYVMYDHEPGPPGRAQHPGQVAHFPQGGYNSNPQQPTGGSTMACPPQFMRNHPYNELIDKLVSMGYRGDHVMSVIQRLDETGQTVDFNAVLDGLNGQSSGQPQRGWSG